jgi:uncharacterized protein
MIGASTSQYAPDFQIKINGEEIPSVLRSSILSVKYEHGIASMIGASAEEGTAAAGRVEIEFANPDLSWLQYHIRGLGFKPFPTAVQVGPIRASGISALPFSPYVALLSKLFPETEGLFDLDNKLDLAMGYAPDSLQHMFHGDITGLEANFPNSGIPTLTLAAHDGMHRMGEGKYNRGFGLLPDWIIAGILSAENMLIPMIDPVVAGASDAITILNLLFKGTGRKSLGQSDLELFREIADTYDADFWVEDDFIVLSRVLGKEFVPHLNMVWGESLMSFTPRVSKIGQVAGIAVHFTLPMIPIDFVLTVSWDFERESLGIKVLPCAVAAAGKSVLGSALTILERSLNNPADITNSALLITRMLRNKLNNRLTGRGETIGNPEIRAGKMVCLDGLGPSFSGNYRVTSASHSIDSNGYRTNFQVRKEILP